MPVHACVYKEVSLGVLCSCTSKGMGVRTCIHVRLLFASK